MATGITNNVGTLITIKIQNFGLKLSINTLVNKSIQFYYTDLKVKYLKRLVEAVWSRFRIAWRWVEERVCSRSCWRFRHSVKIMF